MDDESTREERRAALGAWLRAEHAHAVDALPDDDRLQTAQDDLCDVLGPHALGLAVSWLEQVGIADDDLGAVADDEARLEELLTLLERRRRRGFERPRAGLDLGDGDGDLTWEPAPAGDGPSEAVTTPPPTALLVLAEHGVGDPVWDRPTGSGSPVDLAGLGVAGDLTRRLRDWNGEFERLAAGDGWDGPHAEALWVDRGLELARELQAQLPGVDVRYAHADDDRPLRDPR